jgi:VCBS repeat-containing protein
MHSVRAQSHAKRSRNPGAGMDGRKTIDGFTHIVGPRDYQSRDDPGNTSSFNGTVENNSIAASNGFSAAVFVSGGAGDDEIIALGSSRMNLFGEGGSDILWGGRANNSLDGGDGNDFLIGEGGRDVLVGGTGDDWIWYDSADNWSGQVNGRFYLTAGEGTDTLVLARPQGADLDDISSYVASQAFVLGATLALAERGFERLAVDARTASTPAGEERIQIYDLNGVLLETSILHADGRIEKIPAFAENTPPEATMLLSDQAFAEDMAVSFQLPLDAFSDADGDTLSLTATLADGSALPDWLSFNAAMRTFTGKPPVNHNGSLTVRVTATDPGGLSAFDDFVMATTPVNDAPAVSVQLADQEFADDATISFQLPANAFTDPDGDPLALTATLSDDSALPSWLAFDPGMRTFQGRAPAGEYGPLSIRVTAMDRQGLSVSDDFNIAGRTPFYTLPRQALFVEPAPGATVTAKLATGEALPSWLVFDLATLKFSGIPPAGAAQSSLVIEILSDDIGGAIASFTLAIPQFRAGPAIQFPVEDASYPIGEEIYIFAPEFADPEDGSQLQLEWKLANGDPLPGWLEVDVESDSLFGTPPAALAGSKLAIAITARDREGNSTTVGITVVFEGPSGPVSVVQLADQSFAEDTAISFQLPENAFTDADDDALALSATLADGTALPSWLSFDAAARAFSGTPPLNYAGSLTVRVTATDPGGLRAFDDFVLMTTQVNDAPTVSAPLADSTSAEDTAISFQLPANAFSDADGDALSLSATLADGTALPSWLSFDAAARTFSGTPPLHYAGSLTVRVTATDPGGLKAFDDFVLMTTQVNDAPTVSAPLADRTAQKGAPLSFQLPDGSFTDVDSQALTYSATLDNGAALPSWLRFDATARTFTGTPPADAPAMLAIRVTASDASLSASQDFALSIAFPPPQVSRQARTIIENTESIAGDLLPGDANDGLAMQKVKETTVAPNGNTVIAGRYGTLILAADGTYTYVLDNSKAEVDGLSDGQQLAETFAFSAEGQGGTANSALVLTIAGRTDIAAPQPPAFEPSDPPPPATATPMRGSSAADTLTGGRGSDAIFGGNGNDIANGGRGNDHLYGEAGDDNLSGGKGHDHLYGGTGSDTLSGGKGNDQLHGGAGNDALSGGKGKDSLFGDDGNDTLDGGKDRDALHGGAGADRLFGGKGNDSLFGDAGADEMWGGKGKDVFHLFPDGARDVIADFENGRDRISLAGTGLGFGDLVITGTDGGTSIQSRDGEINLFIAGHAPQALGADDFILA